MLTSIFDKKTALPFDAFAPVLPEKMVVFGAGGRGQRCRSRLQNLGIEVPFFLDNDPAKHGLTIDNALIVAPDELKIRAPHTPVLVSSWAQESIVCQLFKLGISSIYLDRATNTIEPSQIENHTKHLNDVLHILADEQSRKTFKDVIHMRLSGEPLKYPAPYPVYRHPRVKAQPGDVIIDGGAAEGDTLKVFMDDCGQNCTMHLFEPTQTSFNQLKTFVETNKFKNTSIINMALWSSETTLQFEENYECTHSNRVSESGQNVVKATSIDNYAKANSIKEINLIKLDIEGAELEALIGAQLTIRRFKPKLQICLYHKIEDLWTIPLLINNICPDYKLYISHHSCCTLDTILYCTA